MFIPSIFPEEFFICGFTTKNEDIYSMFVGSIFRNKIYRLKQIHSTKIVKLTSKATPDKIKTKEADCLLTNVAGTILTVWVADCVPVLVGDEKGNFACTIHCGWRGIAGGIVYSAFKSITENYSVNPSSMIAAIGPSIGPCCYEVGADVAGKLMKGCPDKGLILKKMDKIYADLKRAVQLQLISCNLREKNIEIFPQCTKCNSRLFYSRRRGDLTPRQCGFIGLKDEDSSGNHSSPPASFITSG